MAKRKLVAIEILPVAKKDLQEIVDFIARGSVKYANLEKRLRLLQQNIIQISFSNTSKLEK